MRGERLRVPTLPGAYIRQGFVEDLGMTQGELARRLGVSRRTVNELVNGRRAVSADMALRLGRLSCTSPEFWLNLQQATDLWNARTASGAELDRIVPIDLDAAE